MKTSSAQSSKRFWIATALGAIALAVLWLAALGPAWDLARSERQRSEEVARAIERHFLPKGEPLEFVEKALAGEKEALVELRTDLAGVGLEIPPPYRPGPDRDPLYFQKQLSEFRQWVRETGAGTGSPFPHDRPLGFREGVSKDLVPDNLARLAVARRFVEVVARSGVGKVLRARQLSTPSFRSTGAAEIEELAFKATVAADEESLTRLVQEMSRPGSFLSIKGIVIDVRRPTSGTFEATLDVAGVRLLKPAPPGGEPGGGEEGEPEAEGDSGPGVLVPTAPARPGKPPRRF